MGVDGGRQRVGKLEEACMLLFALLLLLPMYTKRPPTHGLLMSCPFLATFVSIASLAKHTRAERRDAFLANGTQLLPQVSFAFGHRQQCPTIFSSL